MKRVFLDTNFIIEILLEREKYNLCLDYLNNNKIDLFISSLSVHITYYIAIKFVSGKEDIFKFLNKFNILDLSATDYEVAKQILKDDYFEDALQIACALSNDIDEFITIDKKLVRNYSDLLDLQFVLIQ